VIVEYVTKDWLVAQLTDLEICDELVDLINEHGNDEITYHLRESREEIVGWGVNDARVADIKDFFVYEMSDGSHFVVAIVLFSLRGTCDYEREIDEPDYDMDIDDEGRRIAYVVGSYTTMETGSDDFEVEIKVTLSVILRDESIQKTYIENWEIVDLIR